MGKPVLAGTLLLAVASLAAGATLKPVAIESFFLTPQQRSAVEWRIESGPLAAEPDYVVRDYTEKQISTGRAERVGADVLRTSLRLAAGFYEIEFPATGQRFGLVALPAQASSDPFFCIDGALSWLVRDDAVREGLVRAAQRGGIRMVRERLSWGAVHPAEKRWDWEGPVHFDTLRRTYAKHGVEVLEMAHDAPRWMGRSGVYPDNLVQAARSWQGLAAHWRPTWGASEVWNEPDISFGGNVPADQYVPLVKAIAYGLSEGQYDVPLVGGVMAHCNREFLDTAAENGLLDCIDAFSFHTYGRAMEMEGLVGRYREWLQAHGHPSMPLWLTECGRPWKKGPERPPFDQDAESALDIAMKAIESRACGIARYFAFVYPFYEENQNNFGMMDKRGTPLRSFAAYAQLVRALAGKRYLGDLRHEDKSILRARVFGDEQQALAVLYTGRCDPKAGVKAGAAPVRLEGIDGRPLAPAAGGAIPVPDGLTYAWLDPGKCQEALVRETPAMRLYAPKAAPVQRLKPSPIAMRYRYDTASVEPTAEGYRIKAVPSKTLPLAVRLFNLSNTPQRVRIGLSLPGGKDAKVVGEMRDLALRPRSSGDVAWEADFTGLFANRNVVEATVAVSGATSGPGANRLAMTFFGEASVVETLQRYGHWVRLPIQELSRWTPNVPGHGKMTMDSTPEAAWRLQVKFGEGDRWVYPFLELPDNVKMSQYSGLVVRARCRQPASVRAFLWEGESGVGYIAPRPVVPADGQWHVAAVRFSDLVLSPANKPDPNGRLDLDQVRRISIGMNSTGAENTLEVSDACVVADKP